jgi:hypothetical protein
MEDSELSGGPLVPELRASDQDREQTLELLSLAVSDGQLTLDEYSERVDLVLAARMRGELTPVTSDLQQAHSSAPARQGPVPDLGPQKIKAVLASNSRRGEWKVPAHLQVSATLGECELELQSAVLTSHHTVIEARAVLGSVTIFVPEGIEIDLSGSVILGEKKSEVYGKHVPGAPVIEIRAKAILGEVSIKHSTPRARPQLDGG